jgi:cystathionine gamma-synthase
MSEQRTDLVSKGRPEKKPDGAINPSIVLSTTFHAPNEVGYGRYGNETWNAFEEVMQSLEGGRTLAFASGMAAISAVFNVIPNGSVVVASKNGYSGTNTVLKQKEESKTFEVRWVDVSDTDEVLNALKGANLFWLESPTNPALEVADMPKVIKEAKDLGVLVGVDNTFATALNQKPLDMGADISMNSATKFIAGHSDVLLGTVSSKNDELLTKIEGIRKLGGAIPGPFEVWLALRGIRTLDVRLQRAQTNALEIAMRLEKDPRVAKVRYPGLESHPQHARAKSFMKNFGAVLGFEPNCTPELADQICSSSKLIAHATSLGGVETLWERRHRWSAESPTIPKNLIRISVGIEDVEDLWNDISQALNAVK